LRSFWNRLRPSWLDCAANDFSDNPWELLAPFTLTLIKPENGVKRRRGDYLRLPFPVSFRMMPIVLGWLFRGSLKKRGVWGLKQFLEINEKKRNHVWVKLFILLLIMGGVGLFFYESDLFRFFLNKTRMLLFLDSLGPWSFVGFITLQAFQVIAAPIPGEVTGLLGGYLYGPFLGILLSTAGLTLGSFLAFMLSRAFGRPFAEKFVPDSAMQRFDYLLHHKGLVLVFLLFLIPGFPKDYLCYILGLGHLSILEFLVIGTVGRLFGTVLLTLGGNFLRLEQYMRFSILVIVALGVISVALIYRDKIEQLFAFLHSKSMKKEQPMQNPER
jgi:uncharacterized membrane protein YdjX (TVP38/TMEM64 family)